MLMLLKQLINKFVIYLKRFSKDFNGMKNDIEQQGNGYQRKANQIENQIVMKMKDYNDAYNIGFENALQILKVINKIPSIKGDGYCF